VCHGRCIRSHAANRERGYSISRAPFLSNFRAKQRQTKAQKTPSSQHSKLTTTRMSHMLETQGLMQTQSALHVAPFVFPCTVPSRIPRPPPSLHSAPPIAVVVPARPLPVLLPVPLAQPAELVAALQHPRARAGNNEHCQRCHPVNYTQGKGKAQGNHKRRQGVILSTTPRKAGRQPGRQPGICGEPKAVLLKAANAPSLAHNWWLHCLRCGTLYVLLAS
jgi:hypothetical protein